MHWATIITSSKRGQAAEKQKQLEACDWTPDSISDMTPRTTAAMVIQVTNRFASLSTQRSHPIGQAIEQSNWQLSWSGHNGPFHLWASTRESALIWQQFPLVHSVRSAAKNNPLSAPTFTVLGCLTNTQTEIWDHSFFGLDSHWPPLAYFLRHAIVLFLSFTEQLHLTALFTSITITTFCSPSSLPHLFAPFARITLTLANFYWRFTIRSPPVPSRRTDSLVTQQASSTRKPIHPQDRLPSQCNHAHCFFFFLLQCFVLCLHASPSNLIDHFYLSFVCAEN